MMSVDSDLASQPTPQFGKPCPFLGLIEDRETRLSFPSHRNHCYRFSPAARITTEYQKNWCVSGKFTDCIVYQKADQAQLPEGITLQPPKYWMNWSSNTIVGFTVVLVVVLAMLLLAGKYVATQNNSRNQSATLTASAAISILPQVTENLTAPLPNFTPTSTATATKTSFPTATLTPTPTITLTPAPPTPGPGLETPFGPGAEYILHRVKAGESARTIAYEYHTTYTVISETNQLLPGGTILVDMVLFIVPNLRENIGLPVFKPILLEEDTSIADLAGQFAISPDDLRRYNVLGPDDFLPAGRWIIIPLPPPASP
jgi:hypothetical protein